MKHKSLSTQNCPIASSLEHVGEWWSMMIMRDALYGLKRFDEFEKSLGIAPNMLTRRLTGLVESGLLIKQPYIERPLRYEYLLTAKGRDFAPVLLSLLTWGNKHFSPQGLTVQIANITTGDIAEPILTDKISSKPINWREFRLVPGPNASEKARLKITKAVEVLSNLDKEPRS